MTGIPAAQTGPVVTGALPADTDARQRLATDPDLSVWVSASAGTGKTTVLTRRVLRLLLPRADGRPGTPPGRILCLTFTKAAASEMKLRLTATLSQWATLPLESASPAAPSLTAELEKLLGRTPVAAEITAARRLFAAVTDAPGGLRIMTIHAFCTALLGAFPLEAGLPPRFATLEEGPAAELMTRARNRVLEGARRDPAGAAARALTALSGALAEDAFTALLQETAKERQQVAVMLASHGGAEGLYRALCAALDVQPGADDASITMEACADGAFDAGGLRAACAALATGTEKTDRPKGLALQMWLDAPPERRAVDFAAYVDLFVKTSDGEARSNQATKGLQARAPACEAILQAEAARLIAVRDRMNAAYSAHMTRALFTLAGAILDEYGALKAGRAALDFDDLILAALALLRSQDMVPWVMFKLDGGIDHILVDEAQDTNPEQWEIIRLLAADFFSGAGARGDVRRTIFAVGDEKQSIYSFQRAAPEKFAAMRELFRAAVTGAGLPWRDVPLDMSFRTVPPVLRLVDETFAPPVMRAGLGDAPVRHDSRRAQDGGLAEIWPLFVSAPRDDDPLWRPPVSAQDSPRAAAVMARHISATIARWLDPAAPEMLASQGRPVQPGDIMILVRTRTTFVNQVIRALKGAGIPVGGVDRMALAEQLAVRDMAAVAQAALLPADDLTLACVLKSPFVGWTDARLEELAAYRPAGQTLWEALRATDPALAAWFAGLQQRAGAEDPFTFFTRLAQEPCPADPVSGQHALTARLGPDCLDPLEEFLSAALAFESGHIAALPDFLLWLARDAGDIKREQEEAGGSVRIMTVHGAKGLQAPVVILPDTLRATRGGGARAGEKLLWPAKADIPLPLWTPRADRACALYRRGKQTVQDRMDEEYRRLLYVAMTRAEDRLYVAGFRNEKAGIDESWYNRVAAAFDRLGAQAQDVPFAYPGSLDPAHAGPAARRIAAPQETTPRDRTKARYSAATAAARPDDPALGWLYKPPAAEPQPPQPLIPSRMMDDGAPAEPAVLSPLAAVRTGATAGPRHAGTLAHRLLQILPDIPPAARARAAADWAARQAPPLPPETVAQVMAIMEDPSFAPLFAPGSLAEVPVTGLTPGGRIVSGQIDRLAFAGDEIWIIDYKTGRNPPADAADTPAAYRRQMAAYAAVLRGLYPGRPVRAFLLWTAGPLIMEIVDGTGGAA